MINVCDNICFLRKILGISQQQMADWLHISLETYEKTEREEVELTVKRLIKISSCFELSVTQVIEFNIAMFKSNFIINFDLFIKQ